MRNQKVNTKNPKANLTVKGWEKVTREQIIDCMLEDYEMMYGRECRVGKYMNAWADKALVEYYNDLAAARDEMAEDAMYQNRK